MFGKVIIDWQNRIYVEGFDGFAGILWHAESPKIRAAIRPPLREKRVNRFRSDVHAEPHLDEQPDDEGKRRDAQRDAGHLREAAFEGQVLGDGDIVVEDDDDQHHDRQHGAEREQIALGRKEQVRQNEQRHGDQVGDARCRRRI